MPLLMHDLAVEFKEMYSELQSRRCSFFFLSGREKAFFFNVRTITVAYTNLSIHTYSGNTFPQDMVVS